MDTVKIKDRDDLVKDGASGAVLATPEALSAYRRQRVKLKREKDREKEFSTLKNEVKDMKSILLEVLQKIDKLS